MLLTHWSIRTDAKNISIPPSLLLFLLYFANSIWLASLKLVFFSISVKSYHIQIKLWLKGKKMWVRKVSQKCIPSNSCLNKELIWHDIIFFLLEWRFVAGISATSWLVLTTSIYKWGTCTRKWILRRCTSRMKTLMESCFITALHATASVLTWLVSNDCLLGHACRLKSILMLYSCTVN